ncbi:MAG: hypothetical protein KIT60_06960 [Burkholderiaceae bacterium]|nr:hypothetical protein [Burkholderiaceae bacterium]
MTTLRAWARAIVVLTVLIALGGFALEAQAQVPAGEKHYCLPKNGWADPAKIGGVLMQGRDEALRGDWWALWCKTPYSGAASAPIWQFHWYAALDEAQPPGVKPAVQAALKLWQAPDMAAMAKSAGDLISAVWDTPATLSILRDIFAALWSAEPAVELQKMLVQKPPERGTQRFDDLAQLGHQACQQAAVLPPWVSAPLPAASAVIACTAPQPTVGTVPVDTYVVTGARAYPLNADGSRNTAPIPQLPTAGAACDCALKLIPTLFGGRYCAVSIFGVAQTVVAGCSLKRGGA